ncbi:MAG: hypothetical protein ACRC80_13765 [Waterburya sp.]
MEKLIEARLERLRAIANGQDVSQIKIPKDSDIEIVFGSERLTKSLAKKDRL